MRCRCRLALAIISESKPMICVKKGADALKNALAPRDRIEPESSRLLHRKQFTGTEKYKLVRLAVGRAA
jgi:hypothetical protein